MLSKMKKDKRTKTIRFLVTSEEGKRLKNVSKVYKKPLSRLIRERLTTELNSDMNIIQCWNCGQEIYVSGDIDDKQEMYCSKCSIGMRG